MWQFFQDLAQAFMDRIGDALSWLGMVWTDLFNALKQFFALLLAPLLSLVKGILYLLQQSFVVVVLVVQVVFGLFELLGGIIVGIFSTFGQLLAYAGSGTGGEEYYYLPSAYQEGWRMVADYLNTTGFGTLALVLAVFVWLVTAYGVIRIVGGEK